MSKKHSKQTQKQLCEIINSPSNLNRCGECDAEYPTWASWNLGLLLCGRCANSHKKVLFEGDLRGEPFSYVKSLTLEVWTDAQIERLRSIGNRAARQKWNPKRVPFPLEDDNDTEVDTFICDKYILGKFRHDFDDGYGSGSSSGRARPSRSRSWSRATPLPRLSHRKLTTHELSQYASQARDILSCGFTDRDAVVESLILSKGNIDEALYILAYDAQVNPSLAEHPSYLPQRPLASASALLSDSAGTAGTAAASAPRSADWWSAQATGTASAATTVSTGPAASAPLQPQIYQYTDPVMGLASYVYSNGQHYLNSSNQQHQTLMLANPQDLARQQTNQNILSLYNRPQLQQQQQQEQYSMALGQPNMQMAQPMVPMVQQMTYIQTYPGQVYPAYTQPQPYGAQQPWG